jgi:hypothetical protein
MEIEIAISSQNREDLDFKVWQSILVSSRSIILSIAVVGIKPWSPYQIQHQSIIEPTNDLIFIFESYDFSINLINNTLIKHFYKFQSTNAMISYYLRISTN